MHVKEWINLPGHDRSWGPASRATSSERWYLQTAKEAWLLTALTFQDPGGHIARLDAAMLKELGDNALE